jgi:alpha-L-fucosidase
VYCTRSYLEHIDQVIDKGPYKNSWNSLGQYQVPQWFKDSKFGIFIHWGVYSVPAFSNEWYPRNMYIQDSPEFKHHIQTYGEHAKFGYKDLIPLFTGDQFDPEEWADLFEKAGAKYVVPVAEHHDGFQMYRSRLSKYNAYEMGPKRDVLGELSAAFEKRGMLHCASSHRAAHWFFMGHGRLFPSDIREPLVRGDLYWPAQPEADLQDLFSQPEPSQEYLEDWLLRCCEIVDRYRPRLFYFDWWIHHQAFKPYLKKFAAYYYNRMLEWGEDGVITYKHDAFMFGTAVVDVERGQFAEAKPYVWQTDTAVAKNSWCYTEQNVYKSSRQIISDLVDIVSKNGTLLLNIGPRADGTIPPEDTAILLDIGRWLKVNGEAIFGSRVWRVSQEGPTKISEGQFTDHEEKKFTSEDIRFTVKGSHLYATVLHYPLDGAVTIKSLGARDAASKPYFHGIIRDVTALGFPEKISWQRSAEGLEIRTRTVSSEFPVVLKIKID